MAKRVTHASVEVAMTGTPAGRVTSAAVEVAMVGTPTMRMTVGVLEVAYIDSGAPAATPRFWAQVIG